VAPFLTSLAIVLLAEMGDKTQLLAMAFASRFRWQAVISGVFVATLVNHFLAHFPQFLIHKGRNFVVCCQKPVRY